MNNIIKFVFVIYLLLEGTVAVLVPFHICVDSIRQKYIKYVDCRRHIKYFLVPNCNYSNCRMD